MLTGGTMDSTWSGKTDTAIISEHSVIPNYFRTLIIYPEVEFSEICMKDSRNISGRDIDLLLETIEKSKALMVVVTHGTYTMPDTAKFIEANLKRADQTIIFTGSMIPLDGFYPTDAPFNLGYALANAQHLSPGVYLCMNGDTFTPNEVAKNLHEGIFYSVFRQKNAHSLQ